MKNFAHTDAPDVRKLYNEAANDGEHQEHDEYLEKSEAPHGAIRVVKYENNDDIDCCDCASSNQRDFEKKI
jgi:hypothetical protein